MQKRILGKTGLEISTVIFGGIMVSEETQATSDYYISYAYDRGVNYFDVAPNYGDAQIKMGPSLRPYRHKVFLACKTFERSAEAVRKDFENSLKYLETDYFDVYQLHCLYSLEDVDKAFAEDGAMKVILEAKEKGYVRYVGLTAHDEASALKAMAMYDFDTVMFPLNWAIGLGKGIGLEVSRLCKERQVGLIGMKALAHRIWREGEEQVYPKSWTKPVTNDDGLFLRAMKYAYSLGADAIVPPGVFEPFEKACGLAGECLANPLAKDDVAYLKSRVDEIKDAMIF